MKEIREREIRERELKEKEVREKELVQELLESKQYTRLRQHLSEQNEADVAAAVSYTHLDVYKRQSHSLGQESEMRRTFPVGGI